MPEKFANGSLVTYLVRDTFVPRTPAQISTLAQQHQMPESLVPAYAGDRAIAGRAMQAQIGPAARTGWLVKSLESSKTKLVYTVARIEKDVERERTDYAHETIVKWTSELPGHIEGWHDVALAMDSAYQALRGMVGASDWTERIIAYIKEACQGVAFLESGKLYWVPPQGTQQLEALRGLLDAVGIGLVIGEIAPENHVDAQTVARGGLNEQLEALQDEVSAFDGTQPASVYRGRLAQLHELHVRTLAYEEALGVKFAEARSLRAQVQAKVRELLVVRESTVFHKDGTVETLERPSLAAQIAACQRLYALGETAIAQALLDGHLDVDLALVGMDDDEAVGALDPALALELATPLTPGDLPDTF